MVFAKRIFLFLAVNVLVIFTISLILNVLNVRPYLQEHGLDYTSLATFCLIWGMGGAFISLALSRKMAKWMLGVRLINIETQNPEQQKLIEIVYSLAREAKLPVMPEVGIYESREVNAFATGPSRSRSLVAVSSGLLNRMSQKELEGVIGHEIAHIANGDMVTMTLLQGVVNAFVMFLARVLAFAITSMGQKNRSSPRSFVSYTVFVILFEILFMVLGTLVIAWYSRMREFRADKGGSLFAGKDRMIAALEALQRTVQIHDPAVEKPALQAFKISTTVKKGLSLFATHPPLERRLARLRGEFCTKG